MRFTRKNILYRYNQFSVDRNISKQKLMDSFNKELKTKQIFKYVENNQEVLFYYQQNKWETEYFKINSIILYFIDFKNTDLSIVKLGLTKFIKFLKNKIDGSFIVTSEIPSEDKDIIQILNNSKFRTIETRLHYYNNNLNNYNYQRYNVRDAIMDDIPNLKKVVSFMRNEYDRFHSDWSFDMDLADSYLETYIENSIKGFADVILVPNEPSLNSDSFLTANFCKSYWKDIDYPISKMVLSAVSSETNKGWYIKLISEMTYRLMKEGVKSIYMNTQSTNVTVLHTWEKLGYKIGRVTHLLSLNSND